MQTALENLENPAALQVLLHDFSSVWLETAKKCYILI